MSFRTIQLERIVAIVSTLCHIFIFCVTYVAECRKLNYLQRNKSRYEFDLWLQQSRTVMNHLCCLAIINKNLGAKLDCTPCSSVGSGEESWPPD